MVVEAFVEAVSKHRIVLEVVPESPASLEVTNGLDYNVVGSPKVGAYKGWRPEWDTRWFDSSKFSSNDWSLLKRKCNSTDPTVNEPSVASQ